MNILETIRCLQNKREEEKITPCHVPINDLMNVLNLELRAEINELYKNGKIGVEKTINSKNIFIKE